MCSFVSPPPHDPTHAQDILLYKLKDAIAARKAARGEVAESTAFDYSRAAWLKLGSLNAGQISAASPDRALPLLAHAAPQPISKAYPIFAWFIENAIRFKANSGNAQGIRQYVLPLFEACLRGAELSVLTAQRDISGATRGLSFAASDESGEGHAHLIGGGQREKALRVLREWLSEQTAETIFIAEPYFHPEDVHMLTLIRDAGEDVRVVIVTGRD